MSYHLVACVFIIDPPADQRQPSSSSSVRQDHRCDNEVTYPGCIKPGTVGLQTFPKHHGCASGVRPKIGLQRPKTVGREGRRDRRSKKTLCTALPSPRCNSSRWDRRYTRFPGNDRNRGPRAGLPRTQKRARTHTLTISSSVNLLSK